MATISGTVRDATTGAIIPKVSMTLKTQKNFASYEGPYGSTDSLGRFQFREDYNSSIGFSKYGYYESTLLLSNYIPLNPPYTAVLNVTLKMKPKIAVTGLVTDGNNNPLDSVKIDVGEGYPDGGSGGVFSMYSKKDGSFNFVVYRDKYYKYGMVLNKINYYESVRALDTTQTAQNFTIKMQKRN